MATIKRLSGTLEDPSLTLIIEELLGSLKPKEEGAESPEVDEEDAPTIY